MLGSLAGKSVLLIAPRFFGYEIEIKNEIEKFAHCVDLFIDRPYDKAWQKGMLRVFPALMLYFSSRIYKEWIKSQKKDKYDVVLFLNPLTVNVTSFRMISNRFPGAIKILYMWDSFDNRKHVERLVPFFDKAYSFDHECAKKNGMSYRPLFFINMYQDMVEEPIKYQLSFIGTLHSDRYKIIQSILKKVKINIYGYYYLHAEWYYWLCRFLKPEFRSKSKSLFKFKSLNKTDVHSVFIRSFAILDIEHPKQNGLTIRTFEALGAGKKLVTTNKNIVNHDFYNENNIVVIDRCNPVIPKDFFETSYQKISDEIYAKYSLKGFLDEVFESVV